MCSHPRLIETARVEACPDCGYEFRYGDAHASGEASRSKLVNPGYGNNAIIRLSRDGRDVTKLPGLWEESDRIYTRTRKDED